MLLLVVINPSSPSPPPPVGTETSSGVASEETIFLVYSKRFPLIRLGVIVLVAICNNCVVVVANSQILTIGRLFFGIFITVKAVVGSMEKSIPIFRENEK